MKLKHLSTVFLPFYIVWTCDIYELSCYILTCHNKKILILVCWSFSLRLVFMGLFLCSICVFAISWTWNCVSWTSILAILTCLCVCVYLCFISLLDFPVLFFNSNSISFPNQPQNSFFVCLTFWFYWSSSYLTIFNSFSKDRASSFSSLSKICCVSTLSSLFDI